MGIETFDLADSLLGIFSQRLARTVCEHCAVETTAEDPERRFLTEFAEKHELPGCVPLHVDAWHKMLDGRLDIKEVRRITHS